ncbi:hypothetical protein N0V82_005930 [Gnomoniopsis sp. IMI 355080]|nr:hypothetical protein N0V82_005930 [Gnomoniopsis sp. IMI 355080]
MAPRRRTIEEYGMRRLPVTFTPDMVDFMAPYFAVPGQWKAYEIRGSNYGGSEDTQFNSYAVNIEAEAYCNFSVKTQDEQDSESNRLTRIDYRDMIIDNYAAAGGGSAEMKVLGTRNILDKDTRKMVEDAFKSKKKDPTKPGSVRLGSSEAPFNDFAILQPFARNHTSVDKQYDLSTGFAEISEFIICSEGLKAGETTKSGDSPVYHLITLLQPPHDKDAKTAEEDAVDAKLYETSMKNSIGFVGDAISSLKDAKDDADGDQRIRDAIKILDDAIRQLRSSEI